MRIWALSDLHLSHPDNRGVLESLPAFPDDWLLLAGDVTHGTEQLDRCLRELTGRFRQVVWVPGNHELWTVPRATPRLGGVALYERLVRIARSHGVLTPEDPYPVAEHPDGPVLIAPLFLLYDYSFRPRHAVATKWLSGRGRMVRSAATNCCCTPIRFPTGIRGARRAARTPKPGSRRTRRICRRS